MAAGGSSVCDVVQLGGALLPLAQLKSLYPSALSKKGSEGQADWQLSTVSTYIYIYNIYIYVHKYDLLHEVIVLSYDEVVKDERTNMSETFISKKGWVRRDSGKIAVGSWTGVT